MESLVSERLQNIPQQIQCEGKDFRNFHNLFGTDIEIFASNIDPTESNTASNMIKFSQISKFEWEEKYYNGNLVSCNNKYIAYVLPSKKNDDHVRVINLVTSMRVLLRGFTMKVIDLCFESLTSNLLACVDQEGTLFIFEILEEDGTVKSKNILTLFQDQIINSDMYRVVWSPKVLSSLDSGETILAFSSNTQAYVYDLKRIKSAYPDNLPVRLSEIKHGVICVNNCHSKPITSIAVSPDVRVLATCSLDGEVKFWSLDFNESDSVSCLHEWEPHNGDPVTCLFFCDNLMSTDDSAPFWRYLITGTANNSVLKLWCAVKWVCIQTLTFKSSPIFPSYLPCMKVMLDISAKYLIVSDIYKKVVYICQLYEDKEKDSMIFVSISEFILKEPQLCFSIHSTKVKKKSFATFGDTTEELNGEAEDELICDIDDGKSHSCIVHIYSIQRSALQKLSIKFNVNLSKEHTASCLSNATSSQDDLISMKDVLSDVDSYVESFDEKFNSVVILNEKVNQVDHVLNDYLNEKMDNVVLNSYCNQTVTDDLLIQTVEAEPVRAEKPTEVSIENVNFVGSAEMTQDAANQIYELLQNQQKLISSQQQELREMKDMLKIIVNQQLTPNNKADVDSDYSNRDDLKVFMQLLQKSATSNFNKACKDFNKSCSERLEQAIKELTSELQLKQDRSSQVVNQTVASKIEKSMKHDMKQMIQPALERLHTKYLETINAQILQKLAIWERTFCESTQEFMKSKNFIDSISCAVAGVLEGLIPSSYRESFQNILIPGFEKASLAMYMQINQAFQQGTKQYLEKLEGHLESKRQKHEEKIEPMVATLHEIVTKFQHPIERQGSFDDQQMSQCVERLQQNVVKAIEAVIVPAVINRISQFVEKLSAKPNEDASNVEDLEAKKKRIDKFIETRNFTDAFNVALHADNLSVVVYVCSKVDPNDLFSLEDPFPQNYILSLIQQLSVDLNQDTEIKTKYLEESIMALNPSDDVTKDHMPGVLLGLNGMLNETIDFLYSNDPANRQIKPLKMLLMASKSLLVGE
uniref:Enhancer of mRNA-decapping protein 4 n=1 Tax=Hydra vulgaris TaxID=6087 RepID=T2MBE8_HYDVU